MTYMFICISRINLSTSKYIDMNQNLIFNRYILIAENPESFFHFSSSLTIIIKRHLVIYLNVKTLFEPILNISWPTNVSFFTQQTFLYAGRYWKRRVTRIKSKNVFSS